MRLLIYKPLSLTFGGGFENWLFTIGPELVQQYGMQVSIVTTTSNVGEQPRLSRAVIRERLHDMGIAWTELPYFEIPVGRSPVPTPIGLSEVARQFQDADLVYFDNSYALHDIIVSTFSLRYRKPVLSAHHAALLHDWWLHNAYVKLVTRPLMKRMVASHVLNSDTKRLLEGWGMKVFHVPIGVDTDRFAPDGPRPGVPAPGGPEPGGPERGGPERGGPRAGDLFRVLFVGRFHAEKGIDMLLRLIEAGWRQNRWPADLRFSIAGSGSFCQEELQRLVAAGAPVEALGYVQQAALPAVYQRSHIAVMPSRMETFGIAAAEAQSAGLPVVAANVTGLRDVVLDGQTGTLMNGLSDLADWESAILNYYRMWREEPQRFALMGRAAREAAVRRYALPTVAGQFDAMCRACVSDRDTLPAIGNEVGYSD